MDGKRKNPSSSTKGAGRPNRARVASWAAARLAPTSDYLLAQRIRTELIRETEALLSRYPLVIAPTWPSGAARREVVDGWPLPADPELEPGGRTHARLKIHNAANLGGFPGICLPCGFGRDGLPLSVQLVAGPWEEQRLLDAAMISSAKRTGTRGGHRSRFAPRPPPQKRHRCHSTLAASDRSQWA